MKIEFLTTVPVLPSSDLKRDLKWYEEKMGFRAAFADDKYAAIRRDQIWLHLQWHADTPDDPLLGGSVVRIFVKNLEPLFEEFVDRGTIERGAMRKRTPWNTHEFGVHDLNKNAIFLVQDLDHEDTEAP